MCAVMLEEDQVVSANVEFYRDIADKYDRYESCTRDAFAQAMLQDDVQCMAGKLANRFTQIRCLDCGGGTGNLTLKLLARGWTVTVVDVSSEMLEISKAKVRAAGFSATFINQSVEKFLASENGQFELVSFSSVLHHIYSPTRVVAKVATRIVPGGFFYSNFDPVVPSSRLLADSFATFDAVVAKLLFDRKDLLPGVARRLRKLMLPHDAVHARAIAGPGDLAEYHVREGLDDSAVVEALQKEDFDVTCLRYAAGRTKMTRWMNSRLQAAVTFKIMAERKDNHPTNL
ncbi:MAG: class I SAM-dependent methyltransferase [Acidobacteriota bacterium]|nr:class I SAM-dependent methyltransferase [Acidobacteriota bacterium]